MRIGFFFRYRAAMLCRRPANPPPLAWTPALLLPPPPPFPSPAIRYLIFLEIKMGKRMASSFFQMPHLWNRRSDLSGLRLRAAYNTYDVLAVEEEDGTVGGYFPGEWHSN